MRSVVLITLFVNTVLLGACRSGEVKTADPLGYQTVGKDVHRKTEIARKKTTLANASLEAGRLNEAEKLLKEALSADVMFGPAHNNLGKVYYHQQKLYLAAWEFQYAIGLMPGVPEPRNNLGLVFESVGKLNDAVQQYNQALTLEQDNPQFIGNLVRARIRRGDKEEEVRELLADLILRDDRREWIEWASEKLHTFGQASP